MRRNRIGLGDPGRRGGHAAADAGTDSAGPATGRSSASRLVVAEVYDGEALHLTGARNEGVRRCLNMGMNFNL